MLAIVSGKWTYVRTSRMVENIINNISKIEWCKKAQNFDKWRQKCFIHLFSWWLSCSRFSFIFHFIDCTIVRNPLLVVFSPSLELTWPRYDGITRKSAKSRCSFGNTCVSKMLTIARNFNYPTCQQTRIN